MRDRIIELGGKGSKEETKNQRQKKKPANFKTQNIIMIIAYDCRRVFKAVEHN